jgi:hypothetical protein
METDMIWQEDMKIGWLASICTFTDKAGTPTGAQFSWSVGQNGYGELVINHDYTTGDTTIIRADPKILVSADFLRQVRDAQALENIVYPRGIYAVCAEHLPGEWVNQDALLHIDGVNRHVVYRITHYDDEHNAWVAIWPD